MRLTTTTAALSCALVLALGGCTSEPTPILVEPTTTPSTSPEPSTEPSTEPSPTLGPRQAERALIEAWVEAFSISISTGNPQPWLDLSDPRCSNCKILAENLRAAHSGDARIEGGRWTLLRARYVGASPNGSRWDFDVRQAEERWLNEDGGVDRIVPAGVNPIEVAISELDLTMREISIRR